MFGHLTRQCGALSPTRRSLQAFVALAVLTVAASTAQAVTPCVHFDVTDVVTCRPVTQEQFQGDHPGEMLIEATFEVSSLVRLGSEGNLSQFLYVIESPQRTLLVHDYAPKTQLVTEVAGNVGIQKNTEKSSNLGINASFNTDLLASASANASTGQKRSTNLKYELLPPKQLLAASGTIARRTAVYFKLKPSAQTSMDGARKFSVIFRVDDNWRGDYVRVRCAAYDRSMSDKPICGSSDFLVGLHLVGDETARQTVAALSRADRRLRQLAQDKRNEVQRQRFPSTTDKLGALFNVSRPKIPDDWLRRAMRVRSSSSFERYLPSSIQEAVQQFRQARGRVIELNRTSNGLAAS